MVQVLMPIFVSNVRMQGRLHVILAATCIGSDNAVLMNIIHVINL